MGVPKAVVFDLGKVLLEFDFSIFARNLAKNATLSAEAIVKEVVGSEILIDYEYGRTTSQEFFQQVKAATGYQGDFRSFEPVFGAIFTEMTEMTALHGQLRAQKIPTYIFSNTNEIAIQIVREQYEFFQGFDDYIFSYEHQAMKPESALYEVVEQRSALKGSDLVFIDDKPENIHAAKERGWHGIVQQDSKHTQAGLRALGLPVD